MFHKNLDVNVPVILDLDSCFVAYTYDVDGQLYSSITSKSQLQCRLTVILARGSNIKS